MNKIAIKIHGKIHKIFEGQIAKNIFLIASGTALAQLFGIIISPVLTRIYSPSEFGILTIYTAILGLFAGSQSLRYELAIPIAEDDESSVNIIGLSFLVLFLFVMIISTLLALWGDFLLTSLSAKSLVKYRLLIPIGFALYGAYQIFMMWNYRTRDFKSISKTKVTQSISGNLMKVVFGVLGLGPIGLIVGKIIGESAGIRILSIKLFKVEKPVLKLISWNKMVSLAKRYAKFPVYSLPSTFLSKVATQLPILFIAYNFGDGVVGYFGFALSMVSLPLALIGNSVGDVFYAEAASIGRVNPGRLKVLSKKILKKLIYMGSIPLIISIFFAPILFKIVFGNEWQVAGDYARVLAFLSFVQLIFQPISRIYDIYERQKDVFVLTIIRVTLVILIFTISTIIDLESLETIGLYVIAMIIIYAITYIRANMIINMEITKNDLFSENYK